MSAAQQMAFRSYRFWTYASFAALFVWTVTVVYSLVADGNQGGLTASTGILFLVFRVSAIDARIGFFEATARVGGIR